jgi:ATP synthase F1 gamma subunit
MASLKEMRNRIASVKSIQKITKALQMVAAAKLRGATDAAERARPYARRMAPVLPCAREQQGTGATLSSWPRVTGAWRAASTAA